MRYIIYYKDGTTFTSDWYSHENIWSDNIAIVYDLSNWTFSDDGKEWKQLQFDNL